MTPGAVFPGGRTAGGRCARLQVRADSRHANGLPGLPSCANAALLAESLELGNKAGPPLDDGAENIEQQDIQGCDIFTGLWFGGNFIGSLHVNT